MYSMPGISDLVAATTRPHFIIQKREKKRALHMRICQIQRVGQSVRIPSICTEELYVF